MNNSLSENPLICTNDDCRGRDFTHAGGTKWKCVYCGTIVELKQKTVKTKVRPTKEILSAKEHVPLSLVCEQCGIVIGTINHPREEQHFNKDWQNHICNEKSNIYI